MGNAKWRVLGTGAMFVLLAVVIWAVKARLPDTGPAREPEGESGSATLIVVHVILVVAVAALVVSIVVDRRGRPTSPSDINELSARFGRSPRTLLYAVAAAAALMLLVAASFAIPSPTSDRPYSEQSDPDDPEQREAPPTEEPERKELPTSIVVLGGLLLVLTATGVAVAFLRRPPPETDELEIPGVSRASSEETLARAAAVGLAAVSAPGLDPRAAIIACYLAMEAEFASDPEAAPLESDTPSEVLARAVRRGAVHDQAAAELVGLFTEARFSTHDMTEDQRADAVRLLQRVERDLGSRHPS